MYPRLKFFVPQIIILLITTCLLLQGCDHSEESTESTNTHSVDTSESIAKDTAEPKAGSLPESRSLLHEPVPLSVYEVPSQALLQWYEVRNVQPALLIYANNPLLSTSPFFKIEDLLQPLADDNPNPLRYGISNPAMMPGMTLHAALEAGLFSAVYWIMPTKADITDLSIEVFRKQMKLTNALSYEEAQSLTLRDGVFSGRVRGVPFHAIHPEVAYTIPGPTVFHFDLGYLASLHEGEIKTQVFPLIYQTLKHLRDLNIKTVSASFSYSQVTREVAFGSRFIAPVFKQLFEQPQLLDEQLPKNWKQRADALYLPNMFMVSDGLKIFLQMAKDDPADPSLQYALYELSRASESTHKAALFHLAEAVKRDPVYALEYLYLVPLALKEDRTDEALRMLRLAHEALPDNPFVSLKLAQGLMAEGQGDQAVPLLQSLLAEEWSVAFYPDMPEVLEQMLADALEG
jgi:tetratricopeptide (TPR) repeat protein